MVAPTEALFFSNLWHLTGFMRHLMGFTKILFILHISFVPEVIQEIANAFSMRTYSNDIAIVILICKSVLYCYITLLYILFIVNYSVVKIFMVYMHSIVCFCVVTRNMCKLTL